MFWHDDFDDLFDILNDIFPDSYNRSSSKHIDYRESERVISDDNVYYTLVIKDVKDKGDIKVYNDDYNILITLQDELNPGEEETITLLSPRKLVDEKIDWTYVNGILDITTYIDKEGVE